MNSNGISGSPSLFFLSFKRYAVETWRMISNHHENRHRGYDEFQKQDVFAIAGISSFQFFFDALFFGQRRRGQV